MEEEQQQKGQSEEMEDEVDDDDEEVEVDHAEEDDEEEQCAQGHQEQLGTEYYGERTKSHTRKPQETCSDSGVAARGNTPVEIHHKDAHGTRWRPRKLQGEGATWRPRMPDPPSVLDKPVASVWIGAEKPVITNMEDCKSSCERERNDTSPTPRATDSCSTTCDEQAARESASHRPSPWEAALDDSPMDRKDTCALRGSRTSERSYKAALVGTWRPRRAIPGQPVVADTGGTVSGDHVADSSCGEQAPSAGGEATPAEMADVGGTGGGAASKGGVVQGTSGSRSSRAPHGAAWRPRVPQPSGTQDHDLARTADPTVSEKQAAANAKAAKTGAASKEAIAALHSVMGKWRDTKRSQYHVFLDSDDATTCTVRTTRPGGGIRVTRALIRLARGTNGNPFRVMWGHGFELDGSQALQNQITWMSIHGGRDFQWTRITDGKPEALEPETPMPPERPAPLTPSQVAALPYRKTQSRSGVWRIVERPQRPEMEERTTETGLSKTPSQVAAAPYRRVTGRNGGVRVVCKTGALVG